LSSSLSHKPPPRVDLWWDDRAWWAGSLFMATEL